MPPPAPAAHQRGARWVQCISILLYVLHMRAACMPGTTSLYDAHDHLPPHIGSSTSPLGDCCALVTSAIFLPLEQSMHWWHLRLANSALAQGVASRTCVNGGDGGHAGDDGGRCVRLHHPESTALEHHMHWHPMTWASVSSRGGVWDARQQRRWWSRRRRRWAAARQRRWTPPACGRRT